MKTRNLLMGALCIFMSNVLFAQLEVSEKKAHFVLGINGGVTTGDYDDIYSSNLGIDIIYFYSISSKVHAGITTGFANYFGKEVDEESLGFAEFEDLQIIPITGSIRFSPFKNFLAGVDIGYATTLDSEIDGGFYASPRATYLVGGKFPVFAGYRTIGLDENLQAIQFGVGYIFK